MSSRFLGRNWLLLENYRVGESASKPLVACGASRAPDCAHNRSKHVSSRLTKRMSFSRAPKAASEAPTRITCQNKTKTISFVGHFSGLRAPP